MSENSINYFDTFGISTVHRVCSSINIDLEAYTKSKQLLAIKLTERYNKMSLNEKLCMLVILHDAFNGQYRDVIQKMNISRLYKENYIQMAKNKNF